MSENLSEPQHKLSSSVGHAEIIINWYNQQQKLLSKTLRNLRIRTFFLS